MLNPLFLNAINSGESTFFLATSCVPTPSRDSAIRSFFFLVEADLGAAALVLVVNILAGFCICCFFCHT